MSRDVARTRQRRFGLATLSMVALACALTAPTAGRVAGSDGRAHGSAQAGVMVLPIPEQTLWVGTLDPALTTDADVIQKIYAGLLKQSYDDKTRRFKIVPDLAALPAISKDGLVYTFKIRPDAKFSDGTPVTAPDFVYSLTRVLNPKTASPASYYLYDILGASDYNGGKAKALKGVKALDDRTLQITLWHPATYFLYALTYATGDVVKPNLAIGAPVTTDPTLVIGAGPWMVKNHAWKYRTEIDLVPNPYYPGASTFKLTELHLVFTGSIDTNFAAYQSGQYPITALPSSEVAHFRSTPEFHETPVLGDVFYVMNVKTKPFNNLHFRRAVAYAINRVAIADGVDHGTVHALYCWYPKGITGYADDCAARYPHYDPAIARKELALAMTALKTVPPIRLEYQSENADRGREAVQVQADLKAIGINIGLHPVARGAWLRDGASGKTPFIQSSWYQDYPDPQDFSELLLGTGAGSNWGRYSNPAVDALFARGDVERSPAVREGLYRQAQAIILNEAPVVPIFQLAAQGLISTKYHGLELNPSWGAAPQPIANDWANVSVSP
jgi:ABC-type transport system substrate-binding protein